ncbi:MAG: Na(+)/H(+) antiporter subunit D [Acidiferrobacteraceae bacterium]|nr:Na(+)/H(+) antiporter subunit D [Acidiferrobacteraceae bacterium]MDP6950958.1 Na(+)/H(+) antiporter subunit D [Arenicellales bacterium]
MPDLPPFVLFYLAALAAAVLPQRPRQLLMLAVPIVGGLVLLQLPADLLIRVTFMDMVLEPLRNDRLSQLFGILFHIGAFIGIVFSLHVPERSQHVAALLYAGSALGAVFAGDLLTLFVFWEMLALSSVFLIFANRTERAWSAGMRYLVIQVISGVLLLAGALILYRQNGSLGFNHIGLQGAGGVLIFIAFGIKCAFPLLHNWLTDAYPEATPTGTVFLSAFTTKVAVYALARGFAGTEALVYIGATMTCFPIFYAVIENDLRRVLAYSMINQIGFMVVGIGLGTALAMNGAIAHAFNDVIFKGLLMMSMGAVLHMTGRINGSDLGGLYKSMPVTTTLCIIGAASISAFPLFSGFVSKSMVMVAVLEEGHPVVWLALLFASAGVFHHAGIKIPFFAFFAHDSGIRTTEPPLNMLAAMGIAAILCVFIGTYPWTLYGLLPFAVDYAPFDGSHILAQIQLLVFSAAAFAWLKVSGIYPPELHSTNLDVEWLYRRLAPNWLRRSTAGLDRFRHILMQGSHRAGRGLMRQILHHYGPEGTLARSWPTGSMVLWVAVLLAASLMLYYL